MVNRHAVALMLALAVGGESAEAQGRGQALRRAAPEAGLRIGYDFSSKGPGIGGQIKVPLAQVLDIMPSADFVVTGTRNGWQVNVDGALRMGRYQALYLGGGVGIANGSPEPNIFAGLSPKRRIPGRQANGYFEGRWTLTQPARFMIVLGINFRGGA